jgi:hypothetical protein
MLVIDMNDPQHAGGSWLGKRSALVLILGTGTTPRWTAEERRFLVAIARREGKLPHAWRQHIALLWGV